MDKERVKAAVYLLNYQLSLGFVSIRDDLDSAEVEIVNQALNDWVEKHAEEYDLYSEES